MKKLGSNPIINKNVLFPFLSFLIYFNFLLKYNKINIFFKENTSDTMPGPAHFSFSTQHQIHSKKEERTFFLLLDSGRQSGRRMCAQTQKEYQQQQQQQKREIIIG